MSSQVIEDIMARKGRKLGPAEEAFLNNSLASYAEFAAESGLREEDRAGRRAYQRIAMIWDRLGQVPVAIENIRKALERYKTAYEFPGRTTYRVGLASATTILAPCSSAGRCDRCRAGDSHGGRRVKKARRGVPDRR